MHGTIFLDNVKNVHVSYDPGDDMPEWTLSVGDGETRVHVQLTNEAMQELVNKVRSMPIPSDRTVNHLGWYDPQKTR